MSVQTPAVIYGKESPALSKLEARWTPELVWILATQKDVFTCWESNHDLLVVQP